METVRREADTGLERPDESRDEAQRSPAWSWHWPAARPLPDRLGSLVGGSPKMVGGLAGSQVGHTLGFCRSWTGIGRRIPRPGIWPCRRHDAVERQPDGRYGEVVPGVAYKVNDRTCREYVHRIVDGGRPETGHGTACRTPRGTGRRWAEG